MAAFEIDADIPAGNIIVEKFEGDDVFLRQDLRDTDGHWFYWQFRIRGAAGRTVAFHLTSPPALSNLGPAISLDGGWTWQWLGAECVSESSFTCTIPANAADVRFSMGMPYTRRQLDAFLAGHDGNEHLECSDLCRTRKGRSVPKLRVGKLTEPAHRVLITARHHCCEMMASYALEGIIEAVLESDELGEWMRQNVEMMIVPMVDYDGVQDGDQGKNRKPRDHNRDYDGESVHVETAALRELVPTWSGGKLRVAMDVHCPYIMGGKHNEKIYGVGSSHDWVWNAQQHFNGILEKSIQGSLPYSLQNDLPFGQDWNDGRNFDQGRSFSRWAAEDIPGLRLAASYELPYSSADGVEVNQQTARLFGHDLARALRAYLSEGR